MDSKRVPLDIIRIIGAPSIEGLKNERDYHNFLKENLGYISKNLKLIRTEFPCEKGRADLLCFGDNTLYVVEIKRRGTIEAAIKQLQKYMTAMTTWKHLLKNNIQIKGIIIYFGYPYMARKEYTVNRTPLEPLTSNEEISRIETNHSSLSALKKVIDHVKKDIRLLERRRKKLNTQIERLIQHRENVALEAYQLSGKPLDIILDVLYERGQLVKITASNENIVKVDNLLIETKEKYFVESTKGFYPEENHNEGNIACFYFSPKIISSIFAKIQKLGDFKYIRAGMPMKAF